jgi:hypothetical protein
MVQPGREHRQVSLAAAAAEELVALLLVSTSSTPMGDRAWAGSQTAQPDILHFGVLPGVNLVPQVHYGKDASTGRPLHVHSSRPVGHWMPSIGHPRRVLIHWTTGPLVDGLERSVDGVVDVIHSGWKQLVTYE